MFALDRPRLAAAPSLAIIAAALLAACGAPDGAIAADGAGAASEASRRLIVEGFGEARAQPDQASVSIGVETRAPTPGEAVSRNNARMNETLKSLKAAGLADKDLQTAAISVNAEFDYSETRSSPRVTGYVCANTLRVRIADVSRVGAVLDAAIGAGANRLDGLVFGFADPQKLQDEARAAAVTDARRKAALMANAAGVELGALRELREGGSAAPFADTAQFRQSASLEAMPVSLGESAVTASATLVFDIR